MLSGGKAFPNDRLAVTPVMHKTLRFYSSMKTHVRIIIIILIIIIVVVIATSGIVLKRRLTNRGTARHLGDAWALSFAV